MIKFVLLFFALTSSFICYPASSVSTIIFKSSWVVSKVDINNLTERTLSYQSNDDRLVGRFISFDTNSITSNLPETINCQQPLYKSTTSSIDSLIHEAMGGADSASAKAYDLEVDGKKNIPVLNLSCHVGSFGGGDTGKNSWIGFPDNKKMLVNWFDGTILTLVPVSSNAKPEPSFSCAKAYTPTEKIICSDYNLSSFDKSVNKAWKSAQHGAISVGNQALEEKIKKSQKAWIKKRNSCETDKECLNKSMVERLNVLSSITDGQ